MAEIAAGEQMTNSPLLINEPPLQVLPSLAMLVGLEESIILQQVHFWLIYYKDDPSHIHGNRVWIYNSYEDWHKNFPFLKVSRIANALRKLEAGGFIESDILNAKASDRTKWYTIDYETLTERSYSENLTMVVKKVEPDPQENSPSSLTETTTETTTILNRPEWFETLSEDPRWTGKTPEKYIAAIEKEFPGINLALEAHGAYEWLQTREGQKKKVLRGFWRNWLKNASRPGPGQVAASGRPTRPSAGHSADELKDSIRQSRGG